MSFLKKLSLLAVAVICSLPLLDIHAAAGGINDYVLDSDGKTQIPTPITHLASDLISDLGPKGGILRNPSDFFIDQNDNIFIADTDNNRIVKLDKEGNFLFEYTDGGRLSAPEGVFAGKGGDIYVSDTLNERIVHLDEKDNLIEEFIKPVSDMLDESMNFQTGRIAINPQGYIYIIKGQQFMTIDAQNEFKGYVGANKLGFSLIRILKRTFASKEQRERQTKDKPIDYFSFDIGGDGTIYATTAETAAGQIRVINAVGENIYPEKVYGEKYYNDHIKSYNSPRFIDIAADADGIIYVLEQYSSKIYTYDREGNLLAVFGGRGDVKGYFEGAKAIEVNSKGDVFVLDSSKGYIHKFIRTDFMNSVANALYVYESGDYESARQNWEKVLQIDVNYPPANNGMGQISQKQGDYREAMKYFKLAGNPGGYSNSFSEARYSSFRAGFGWIVLIAAILAAGIVLGIRFLKRRADMTVMNYFGGKRRN